jgi:hypothetical protein
MVFSTPISSWTRLRCWTAPRLWELRHFKKIIICVCLNMGLQASQISRLKKRIDD